jgi:RecB family endonuclease NucS
MKGTHMQYLISKNEKKISRIPDEYVFMKEDEVQEIIAKNPQIVLNIPELEIESVGEVVTCREFPISSGSIDILYLTSAGEIVIVETKLIKNPESTRTVVAQVVDYVKSLTSIKVEEFLGRLNQKKVLDSKFDIGENLKYQGLVKYFV